MKNPKHVFIENIIYFPSQIYYYFSEDNTEWCAYIRQRSGPLTFELIKISGENSERWETVEKIKLSRVYNINSKQTLKEEDAEIEELEEEVLWFLRQRFPHISFPNSPIHKKKQY